MIVFLRKYQSTASLPLNAARGNFKTWCPPVPGVRILTTSLPAGHAALGVCCSTIGLGGIVLSKPLRLLGRVPTAHVHPCRDMTYQGGTQGVLSANHWATEVDPYHLDVLLVGRICLRRSRDICLSHHTIVKVSTCTKLKAQATTHKSKQASKAKQALPSRFRHTSRSSIHAREYLMGKSTLI